jgi:hypothetical protein
MTTKATARRIAQLAKAVSAAFASSGLPPETLRKPQLRLTDLPWQLPPLQTNLELEGCDLDDLIYPTVATTGAKLHSFWQGSMGALHHRPSQTFHRGQYRGISHALPGASLGIKACLFSKPDAKDDYAGILLSLEVARVAVKNLPLLDIQSDDSTYLVKTASGHEFGVRDGLPLVGAADWPTSGEGMVQALLEAPRGEIDTTCYFDVVALARSVLYECREELKLNFAAIDYALQALRVLTMGRGCPAMIKAVYEAPANKQEWLNKVAALTEAEAIMTAQVSDLVRLNTLLELLVPTWYNHSNFRREIFSAKTFPYMLAPEKADAIKYTLSQLWYQVPESMK